MQADLPAPIFGKNSAAHPAVSNKGKNVGGRVHSQVPWRPVQRQQMADTPRIQSDDRKLFFNNLRANTTSDRPFTRSPNNKNHKGRIHQDSLRRRLFKRKRNYL